MLIVKTSPPPNTGTLSACLDLLELVEEGDLPQWVKVAKRPSLQPSLPFRDVLYDRCKRFVCMYIGPKPKVCKLEY